MGEDYTKLRYGTDQVYFKSADQMVKLFKNYEEAIESTIEIDSKIDLKLDFNEYHFPGFPIPEESSAKTSDEYFEQLAWKGLEKKKLHFTKEVEDRFKYEIETIKKMGFSGYLLIVQDFINAKEKNIPVGRGRGSVAGSLVAYTLGITNINPLDYNLLFERFLNPERKSMPDCHKEHHGRSFTLVRFDDSSFDHRTVAFTLEGKHAVAKCRTCHVARYVVAKDVRRNQALMEKGTFLGLSSACQDCHQDPHGGQLSKDCQSCHTAAAWKPASRFEHARTAFPLTGKHSSVKCERCHPGSGPEVRAVKFRGIDCQLYEMPWRPTQAKIQTNL